MNNMLFCFCFYLFMELMFEIQINCCLSYITTVFFNLYYFFSLLDPTSTCAINTIEGK